MRGDSHVNKKMRQFVVPDWIFQGWFRKFKQKSSRGLSTAETFRHFMAWSSSLVEPSLLVSRLGSARSGLGKWTMVPWMSWLPLELGIFCPADIADIADIGWFEQIHFIILKRRKRLVLALSFTHCLQWMESLGFARGLGPIWARQRGLLSRRYPGFGHSNPNIF